jgi:uncharacterized protein (DUF1697 family)
MKYIALLRGINVGGRVIKKDELRQCLEALSLTDVTTILQSGNVIFESDDKGTETLTATLEQGLTDQFHYPAKVFTYTPEAMGKIVEDYPFESLEGKHDYVVFLSKDLGSVLLELLELDQSVEQVSLGERVVYWQVTKGMSLESNFAKLLSKAKYKEYNTVRNLNTIHKIQKVAQ